MTNIRIIQRKMGERFAFADAEPDYYKFKQKIRSLQDRDFEEYLNQYKNGGTQYYGEMLKLAKKLGRTEEVLAVRKADASLAAAKSRANQKKREAEKPSNNDPYYEGDHAFHMGKSKNPYSPGSQDHHEWQEGYDEAKS